MGWVPRAIVLLALVLYIGCAAIALGTPGYGLTSPDVVDTPDRTVTVEEDTFVITEVARVSQGDELRLDARAPPDATYGLYLYNTERRIVAINDGELSGDDSFTFETASLPPGSYVATLYRDGEFEAILPVVVEGYAISVRAEVTVSDDTEARAVVTATLTPDASPPPPSAVELVIADAESGGVVDRIAMSDEGPEYRATAQFDGSGNHTLYVNVRGGTVANGRQGLLGVSDPIGVSSTADLARGETTVITSGENNPFHSDDTASRTQGPTNDSTARDSTGVLTPNPETEQPTTRTDLPLGVMPLICALLLVPWLARRA